MADVVPDARLVYLVRDPVRRLVFHYLHDVARGRERRGFYSVLDSPAGSAYVWPSRYASQLQRYQERFPEEQVLVVQSEALLARRRPILRRVFEFLDVDPVFDHPGFDRLHHVTSWWRRLRLSLAGIPKVANLREWLERDPVGMGPRPLSAAVDDTVDLLGQEAEALRRLTG